MSLQKYKLKKLLYRQLFYINTKFPFFNIIIIHFIFKLPLAAKAEIILVITDKHENFKKVYNLSGSSTQTQISLKLYFEFVIFKIFSFLTQNKIISHNIFWKMQKKLFIPITSIIILYTLQYTLLSVKWSAW